jgi:hypothetical protein
VIEGEDAVESGTLGLGRDGEGVSRVVAKGRQ